MQSIRVKAWKNKGFLNGDIAILRTYSMEMPGFNKFKGDALMFEWSGKNVEYLSKKQELVWASDAAIYLENYIEHVAKEAAMINAKQNIIIGEDCNYSFKTKPFDHQLKAFLLSKDHEYYGYFMEMGTGKTKVVIDLAAYLYMAGKINCAVILAPNGVHAQWLDEQLPLHLSDSIPHYKAIYRASVKKSVTQVEALLNENMDALKIVSFNIDALSHKKGVDLIRKFLEKEKCLFVIDESVRIKTPGSLRSENALKLAPLAKYRRIMSGAPITNGYEGLYSQFKFLHPDILGFNSFYTFRNYYCKLGGFEGREIVGYKPHTRDELEKKMEAFTFRTTKKECLSLPEKIYIKRYVELTSEQADLYDGLEEELLTQIYDVKIDDFVNIDIQNTLTKLLRMQQIICGHIVDENQDIHDVKSNRIDILLESIQEALLQSGTKIIIWSRFVHDIYKISARLKEEKLGHVLYYGEVEQRQREAAIQKFKTDENTKIFLAQPASGGTGLNLADASVVVYYSNDFNADTRWQSEDRAHRIGQKKNVTYIDLIARGTVDTKITAALKEKKNLADALLDNPRYLLERRKSNV